VVGSIVLAAILLKLGAYGFYRFFFFSKSGQYSFIIFFAVWGAYLCSQICLNQTDLKSLIAFSSIRHMGVMLAGMCNVLEIGLIGCFIILIRHGFCSSALFYLVNIKYERILRRQIFIIRGQRLYFWFFNVFWFFFLVVNLRAPPFLSLIGELRIFFSLRTDRLERLVVLGLTRFFVAYFCIFLYSSVVHGKNFKNLNFLFEEEIAYSVLLIHLVPLFFMLFVIEILWF